VFGRDFSLYLRAPVNRREADAPNPESGFPPHSREQLNIVPRKKSVNVETGVLTQRTTGLK